MTDQLNPELVLKFKIDDVLVSGPSNCIIRIIGSEHSTVGEASFGRYDYEVIGSDHKPILESRTSSDYLSIEEEFDKIEYTVIEHPNSVYWLENIHSLLDKLTELVPGIESQRVEVMAHIKAHIHNEKLGVYKNVKNVIDWPYSNENEMREDLDTKIQTHTRCKGLGYCLDWAGEYGVKNEKINT